MIRLKVDRILEYYDYPQLILCSDEVNTKYISLLADVKDNGFLYIATKISIDRFMTLLSGKIDLLSVFLQPEIDDYYQYQLNNESERDFEIDTVSKNEIYHYFPEEGLYIGESDIISELYNEAIEKNRTIFQLHIEEDSHQSVNMDTLIDFLKLTQKLSVTGLQSALKNLSGQVKKRIKEYSPSNLNVYALNTGSLKIHYTSDADIDIFGQSDDIFLIDKFFEIFPNKFVSDDEILEILKSNRGHLINSIEKLCLKILESGISYEINYCSPNENYYGSIQVSPQKANEYYNIIKTRNDLKEEIIVVSGNFMLADAERGSWRFKINDESVEISGKSEGAKLSGVTIESQLYEIVCEEKVTEDPIFNKEHKEYILIEIRDITMN